MPEPISIGAFFLAKSLIAKKIILKKIVTKKIANAVKQEIIHSRINKSKKKNAIRAVDTTTKGVVAGGVGKLAYDSFHKSNLMDASFDRITSGLNKPPDTSNIEEIIDLFEKFT